MGLSVLFKDISTFEADAVVNSTNPQLIGYSGVDAILHRLGGESFEKECREKAGTLLPGEALYTRACNTSAISMTSAIRASTSCSTVCTTTS